MTEEEIQQVLKENAELKAALRQKEQRIQELEGLLLSALERIGQMEKRLAKNSHNSRLPPSRDHGTRKPLGQRPKSQKPSGGQAGHPGHTLQAVGQPDEGIVHRPERCQPCGWSCKSIRWKRSAVRSVST